jgi:hypothetical protein
VPQSSLLEFASDAFPVIPGEDEETNPGLFGKSLAEWISLRLSEKGLPVEELVPEDFGWCVPVLFPPYRGYVACCVASETNSEWRVFAFVEGGLLRRLFGADGREEALNTLFSTLKSCLEDSAEVRDLREGAATS